MKDLKSTSNHQYNHWPYEYNRQMTTVQTELTVLIDKTFIALVSSTKKSIALMMHLTGKKWRKEDMKITDDSETLENLSVP